MTELLLLLIAGHYLADFPLQSDFIAQKKSRVFFESIGFHCLTAHAMVQGLVAAVVAMSLDYAWLVPFLIVSITHWLIDFGKAWDGWLNIRGTRGLYGINVDQMLHIIVLIIVTVIAIKG